MNIAVERVNRGLSVRQAADEIGVAPGTLAALEDGRSVYPASAKKVADYFGCKVTDLIPPTTQEAAA